MDGRDPHCDHHPTGIGGVSFAAVNYSATSCQRVPRQYLIETACYIQSMDVPPASIPRVVINPFRYYPILDKITWQG